MEVTEKVETVSKGGFFGGTKISRKSLQINSEEISQVILVLNQIVVGDSNISVKSKRINTS